MNNRNWKATGKFIPTKKKEKRNLFLNNTQHELWIYCNCFGSISDIEWLNIEKWIVPTEICTCYCIGQILPQRSDDLFFMESTDFSWQLTPEFSWNHWSYLVLIIPAFFQWTSNCSPATNYWLWLCIYFYFFKNWKNTLVLHVALH